MSLLDEENLIGLLGNITNLGFPSTYKPSNTGVDYSRTDTDRMSPEEYNRWFQGQGRVARSYPVATALGGVRAAKFLRDSFLRRPVKPSPTTGPLALTDQREEPTDPPLLQGPFQPLMLPPPEDIPFDPDDFEDIPFDPDIEAYGELDEPFEDTDEYWEDPANEIILSQGERVYLEDLPANNQFYTKPVGYYSALEKKARGEKLSQQEQASAMREINYRTMASDTRNESNLDYSRPVPNINSKESLENFMDENPLEFTVRHSDDEYGSGEFDTATHLYFGGTKPNEGSRRHFYSDGRPAQAFIRYRQPDPNHLNIVEVQNEMRGKGNAYEKQVINKLAQQTLVDWAKQQIEFEGREPVDFDPFISIPTGKAIFERYSGGLTPAEQKLLEIEDEVEFYWEARDLYDTAFNIDDPEFFEKVHTEIEILEKLKKDHQGKVKHYKDYTKALEKSLKQHGAIFETYTPDKDNLSKDNIFIRVKNLKEVMDSVLQKGFPIAMNTRKLQRQVA